MAIINWFIDAKTSPAFGANPFSLIQSNMQMNAPHQHFLCVRRVLNVECVRENVNYDIGINFDFDFVVIILMTYQTRSWKLSNVFIFELKQSKHAAVCKLICTKSVRVFFPIGNTFQPTQWYSINGLVFSAIVIRSILEKILLLNGFKEAANFFRCLANIKVKAERRWTLAVLKDCSTDRKKCRRIQSIPFDMDKIYISLTKWFVFVTIVVTLLVFSSSVGDISLKPVHIFEGKNEIRSLCFKLNFETM